MEIDVNGRLECKVGNTDSEQETLQRVWEMDSSNYVNLRS